MRRTGIGVGVLAAVGTVGLLGTPGWAKGKPKPTLPPYVLSAHRVAVLVDPSAGISVEDPRANQVAQKDVEAALMNWGRYEPMVGVEGAELVIVIRRGHGRLVDETISDPRQNNRAGVITPTDNGVGVGAQHGQQPQLGGSTPHTEAEIGGVEDEFAVYEGGVAQPLDGAPAWRWVRKDGLRPHDVPAVGEFRKAVAETEKAIAAQQGRKKP